MHPETDPNVPHEPSSPGVSPTWQVTAVCAIIVIFILSGVTVTLSIAYLAEHRKATEGQYGVTGSPYSTGIYAPAPPVAIWTGSAGSMEDPEAEPVDPPYPTTADLKPASFNSVVGEPPANRAAPSVRDRFVRLGEDVWTCPQGVMPEFVTVSPDGKSLAYVANQALHVGGINGSVMEVMDNGFAGMGSYGGPVVMSGPGGATVMAPPGGSGSMPGYGGVPSLVAASRPSWTADGSHVFFADGQGRLRRYDLAGGVVEVLAFPGDSPVSAGDNKLIFRRAKAAGRIDATGTGVARDPAELVRTALGEPKVEALFAEKADVLQPRVVSPDGRWLVVAAERPGAVKNQPVRQFQLLDLKAGKGAEPRAVGPAGKELDGAFWVQDGKGLVFALKPEVYTPDCWENPQFGSGIVEVYHFDTASDKLTRLTRGGTVSALVGATATDLYLLSWSPQVSSQVMRRVPVQDLLDFAAKEDDRPARTAAAWVSLIDDVLKESDVPADVTGEGLTPEKLAKLAEEFVRLFRERFQGEAPREMTGWERLHREMAFAGLSKEAQPRVAAVMGACFGEYLHKKHRAVWRVGPGPLNQAVPSLTDQNSPFAVVTNPFVLGGMLDTQASMLGQPMLLTLLEADGRTVILTNDAKAGQDALKDLTDPDLQRALDLFEQNKPEEAETLLIEMLKRKPYDRNRRLTVHVGQVLYRHQRLGALQKLMAERVKALPPDARLYNLLGLAILDNDPRTAATHFRDALRCDLVSEAALLNLALAYEKAGEKEWAVQSLRRYLRIAPNRANNNDVRQRLAALLSNPTPGGQ